MQNLELQLIQYYQYAKDCTSSTFSNCSAFGGLLYILLGIVLTVVFIKLIIRIGTNRPDLMNDNENSNSMNRTIMNATDWPDSTFAEFSHERILRKFHKELNENNQQ